MKLPRQIREAVKLSADMTEEMRQQTLAKMNATEAPVNNHSEPAAIEPVVVEPSSLVQPQIEEPQIIAEPAVTPKTETAEYWEHRFKTSQGIFEADRKKLKDKLTKQEEDTDLLRSQVRDLQKAQREQKVTTANASDFLTPDELENYSEDTINLVIKVAQKMAAQQATHVKEDIEDRFVNVEKKVKESEEELLARQQDLFWDSINVNVPDWKAINESQGFLTWITKPDPITGITPDQMIAKAQDALDHKRVIAIFKAYKGSNPSSTVPTRQESRVAPEPVGGSSRASSTPNTSYPTVEEIRQFSRDVLNGRYKNRQLEKEAMDKRIRAAISAGIA